MRCLTPDMLPDESFAYDANGNRIQHDTSPDGAAATHTISYTHDAPVNRITSDGTWNYAFDHNGNVIEKYNTATGEKHAYHYNFQNKLVAHTYYEDQDTLGHTRTRYAFDPLGRRIAKHSQLSDPHLGHPITFSQSYIK